MAAAAPPRACLTAPPCATGAQAGAPRGAGPAQGPTRVALARRAAAAKRRRGPEARTAQTDVARCPPGWQPRHREGRRCSGAGQHGVRTAQDLRRPPRELPRGRGALASALRKARAPGSDSLQCSTIGSRTAAYCYSLLLPLDGVLTGPRCCRRRTGGSGSLLRAWSSFSQASDASRRHDTPIDGGQLDHCTCMYRLRATCSCKWRAAPPFGVCPKAPHVAPFDLMPPGLALGAASTAPSRAEGAGTVRTRAHLTAQEAQKQNAFAPTVPEAAICVHQGALQSASMMRRTHSAVDLPAPAPTLVESRTDVEGEAEQLARLDQYRVGLSCGPCSPPSMLMLNGTGACQLLLPLQVPCLLCAPCLS